MEARRFVVELARWAQCTFRCMGVGPVAQIPSGFDGRWDTLKGGGVDFVSPPVIVLRTPHIPRAFANHTGTLNAHGGEPQQPK